VSVSESAWYDLQRELAHEATAEENNAKRSLVGRNGDPILESPCNSDANLEHRTLVLDRRATSWPRPRLILRTAAGRLRKSGDDADDGGGSSCGDQNNMLPAGEASSGGEAAHTMGVLAFASWSARPTG